MSACLEASIWHLQLRPDPQIQPLKTALNQSSYPSKAELLSALPAELSKLSPAKSWASLAMSAGLSLLAVGLGTLLRSRQPPPPSGSSTA